MESIASVQRFLREYRRFRKAPQLKLRDYSDKAEIEWRCFVHSTSETGLNWANGHLPFSKPEELELRLFTQDPDLPNRIWPILQRRSFQGHDSKLEVTVKGHVFHFYASSIGASETKGPRVDIQVSTITPVEARDSVSTLAGRRKPDVIDAKRFLADWRKVNSDDPAGTSWLIDEMKKAGHPLYDATVRWRCTLVKRATGNEGFQGTFYGAEEEDPNVVIHLKDYETEKRLVETLEFPQEAIVQGSLYGFIGLDHVFIQQADVLPVAKYATVPNGTTPTTPSKLGPLISNRAVRENVQRPTKPPGDLVILVWTLQDLLKDVRSVELMSDQELARKGASPKHFAIVKEKMRLTADAIDKRIAYLTRGGAERPDIDETERAFYVIYLITHRQTLIRLVDTTQQDDKRGMSRAVLHAVEEELREVQSDWSPSSDGEVLERAVRFGATKVH
jgi:hypothetical protein